MRIESVQEVVDRIVQAERGVVAPVIATDADGTLWSGDVGDDAFETLLERGGVRQEAMGALVEHGQRVGVSVQGSPTDVAIRLYEAFRAGKFEESHCFEMMAWAFAGWTTEQVRHFAHEVFRVRGLDERFHGEMKLVVQWLKQRGIPLWVVSASPLIVVQEAVSKLGMGRERVIGTTLAVRGGVLENYLSEPMPYGPGKVAAIDRVIGQCRVVGAFGDETFDLEMLGRADVPVAVRPKDRLRKRASEVASLVELARL